MRFGLLIGLFLSLCAQAIQALELNTDLPIGSCTEVRLGQGKELPIYKDFTLLGMIEIDPHRGDRITERPLLGSFGGVIYLNRLGPERHLKSLGLLAETVGRDEKSKAGPESLFAPVMMCGNNAYSGFLGYVEIEALRVAQVETESHSLPPSTTGNKIPRLP